MCDTVFNCIDTEFFKLKDKSNGRINYFLFEITSIICKDNPCDNLDLVSTFLKIDNPNVFKQNKEVKELTGINFNYLTDAPQFENVHDIILKRQTIDYYVFWGYKDIVLLNNYLSKIKNNSLVLTDKNCIDLQFEYGLLFNDCESLSLSQACNEASIEVANFHNSKDDTIATANILFYVIDYLKKCSSCHFRSKLQNVLSRSNI